MTFESSSEYDFEISSDDPTGYVPRDYEEFPEFCFFKPYEGPVYPRRDWVELIELQRARYKTSPLLVHQYNKIEPMNQGAFGYCWMYSIIGAVLNRYASQGIDPVPSLSAHAVAAMHKNYRNEGGFCIEAAHALQKLGAPTSDVWPGYSMDKRLEENRAVVESRKLHRLVDFQEHARDRVFDETMSALICPVNPSPVAVAFSWWRHAVAALAGTYRKRGRRVEFGIEFVNSYGAKWNGRRRGFGTVWGSKAVPFESVTVRAVSAVAEV